MPLEERQLTEVIRSPSADVQRIIEMAAEEVERAHQHSGAVRVPAFVPSDFQLIASLLAQLSREGLGDGTKFCEWGSGLGIVTMIEISKRTFGKQLGRMILPTGGRTTNLL